MAFRYTSGVTLAGAPDEIVNWFATFEAWMITVGWTVAAGPGTTDIYFQSVGEDAPPPLTMLFIHVYRDGGLPNRVRIDVTDDTTPTHTTAEGGYLDGGGAQFPYWMVGDMDAIVVCFSGPGPVYNTVYAGMVMPFAQTVPDETYRTIATSTHIAGSILRDAGGVWDVDHPLYPSTTISNALADPYDGSLPLGGVFFDRQANIAGQLKHIGARITAPGVTVLDTLETGRPGATSEWVVLADRLANLYPMRTGGVLPAGFPTPGSFAAVTGVAGNLAAFWTALETHLTGLGWVNLGDPGLYSDGRLFFSTGESNEEEIYIGYAWNNAAIDELYPYVQDDAPGTHRAPFPPLYEYLHAGDFPVNYWICGDRDCCVLVYQRAVGYIMIWLGLVPSAAPGLLAPYAGAPLTPYNAVALIQGGPVFASRRGAVLRGHNGIWVQNANFRDTGADSTNSNPSNFDGVTYMLWPLISYEGGPVTFQPLGQLRYIRHSSGGGLANLDTITVAGRVWTAFFDAHGTDVCVRTV